MGYFLKTSNFTQVLSTQLGGAESASAGSESKTQTEAIPWPLLREMKVILTGKRSTILLRTICDQEEIKNIKN
jgi:hypothetical protein